MTPPHRSRPSPAWTVRVRELVAQLVARFAARVRALTSTRHAASAGLSIADQMIGPLVRYNYPDADPWHDRRSCPPLTMEEFDDAARAFGIRPRGHGRLKDCLRYAAGHDAVHVGVETGLLRRSLRVGVNCGTNPWTGEFTAWTPGYWEDGGEAVLVEPNGLLEHCPEPTDEERLIRCTARSIEDAMHCGLTIEQTADILRLLFAGRLGSAESERRIRAALRAVLQGLVEPSTADRVLGFTGRRDPWHPEPPEPVFGPSPIRAAFKARRLDRTWARAWAHFFGRGKP